MEKYFFDYLLALLMKEAVIEEGNQGLDMIFHKGTHFEMRFEDVQRGAFSFCENVFDIKAEAKKMYATKKITKEEMETLEVFQTKVDEMLHTFNNIVELNWSIVHELKYDLHGTLDLTNGQANYQLGNVSFKLDYDTIDDNPLMGVEADIESKLITVSEDTAKKLREDIDLIKKKWRNAMKQLETEVVNRLMMYHEKFMLGDQNGDEAKADIQKMKDIASLIIAD